MIQAIHMIDLLLWVLGMPRRVVAQARTAVHDVEVEDVAVGLLEFEGGVMAALQATTGAMPEQPPSVEIHGDRGTATVSGSWGHLAFRLRTGAEPGEDVEPEPRAARPSVEPYAAQIADFVAAVREGRPPLVDGAEARKALVVVEALYRSAATGGWVTVDPRRRRRLAGEERRRAPCGHLRYGRRAGRQRAVSPRGVAPALSRGGGHPHPGPGRGAHARPARPRVPASSLGRPVDTDEIERLTHRKAAFYEEASGGRVREVPGAIAFVRSLAGLGVRCALATSALPTEWSQFSTRSSWPTSSRCG